MEIREKHYLIIYKESQKPFTRFVCPFCGYELLPAPGMKGLELDHYLARSIYPYAAANLTNLIPMGHECNATYKHTTDILYGAWVTGRRRRKAYFPYGTPTNIKISLNKSKVWSNSHKRFNRKYPIWQIDFVENCEELTTWDQVFKIRERYQKLILDKQYPEWLEKFTKWRKKEGYHNQLQIIPALKNYLRIMSHTADEDIVGALRYAFFEMLTYQSERGNQTLVSHVMQFDLSTL